MYVYAVLTDVKGNYELERFEESVWASQKERIKSDRIKYVTADINDTELDQFNFKEAVWGRVFNPQYRNFKKIKVSFTRNLSEMDNDFNIKTQQIIDSMNKDIQDIIKGKEERKYSEKNQKKYQEWQKSKEETKNLISKNLDEYSAITEWKKLGCIMPPPAKIKEIKETYNMSWRDFKDFIQTL